MRHAPAMNSMQGVDPICYWVLLTPTYQLAYTSPSFNAFVPEHKRLIGKGFMDYLNTRVTDHDHVSNKLTESFWDEEDKGAVINIEYASAQAIRHHLQTGQYFPDHPQTFNTFSLVVSRAGGFILAFMHLKNEFLHDCNFHLTEPLKQGDLETVTPYLPALSQTPPHHVFQVLSSPMHHSTPHLSPPNPVPTPDIIFTTPTTLPGRLTIVPQQLAEGTVNPRESVTNQGQTSCKKRTKISFHVSTIEGQLMNVSCISLRHGNALLVMYRLQPFSPPSTAPNSVMPQPVPPSPSHPSTTMRYNPPPGAPYHSHAPGHNHAHSQDGAFRRLSAASDNFTHSPIQPTGMAQSPYAAYNHSPESAHPSHAARGSFDGYPPPTSPQESARSVMSSHSPHSPVSMRHHHRPGARGVPMRRFSLTEGATSPTTGQSSLSPMGSLEDNSPIHGLHSPTESNYMEGSYGAHRLSTSSSTVGSTLDGSVINEATANALRGRPAKDPPKGVTCCHSCQTTVTPEWRKGPRGVKDMCNACGLRWNRRLKKMKGEGGLPNIPGASVAGLGGGEVSLEGIDTEALLEPQRSGGGSKKGHRKKTLDPNRGPPLTTKLPSKSRRHSDAVLPSSSSMSGFGDDMDQETKYNPPSHPHNPHYSHSGSSNPSSSRPILPPLFKDEPMYSPPPGPPNHLQRRSPIHDSPRAYYNGSVGPGPGNSSSSGGDHRGSIGSSGPGDHRASFSSGDHGIPFGPGSYGSGGSLAGPGGNHHGERPGMHIPSEPPYHPSHEHQPSPHFDRQQAENHGPYSSR